MRGGKEDRMAYKVETKCICGDGKNDGGHPFGAIAAPIFQTATFSHPGIGKSTGYDYTRAGNPTRAELEQVVTSMEGALDTVACASGMAAVGLCLELFEPGSHFVCSEDLYGGSVRIFETVGKARGLTFSYVNTSREDLTEQAINERTKALYIETPSNPTMEVTDLAAMRRIADQHHLLLIVDNTFLSPYLQNPISFGADMVLHSGTKFLSGHNDTLAGFLSVAREEFVKPLRYLYKTVGSGLSPFDSYLVLRGIKTLAVRVERQQSNAGIIAGWLQKHRKIKQVYYVGLPEHPGYGVNQKQARGAGSMISFRTDTEETARTLLERVKLISFAESLGGVESLLTYPMLQTHGDVPVQIREKLGITADFLRMSVGIEHVDDLLADLEQALA